MGKVKHAECRYGEEGTITKPVHSKITGRWRKEEGEKISPSFSSGVNEKMVSHEIT